MVNVAGELKLELALDQLVGAESGMPTTPCHFEDGSLGVAELEVHAWVTENPVFLGLGGGAFPLTQRNTLPRARPSLTDCLHFLNRPYHIERQVSGTSGT